MNKLFPESWTVANNVTQRPYCLLTHVMMFGVEQLEEECDGAGRDDCLRLL